MTATGPELPSDDLDAEQLARVATFGERRAVAAGDVLYAEGDGDFDFYVVVSGIVDVVTHFDGVEELLVRRGPGGFLGELNLLTGQRSYLTARVAEDGEVIAVPRNRFRELLATVPDVSDKVLATFVARRASLLEGAARAIRVVGSRFSAASLEMREYLARNRLPHQWLDPDTDHEVDALVSELGLTVEDLPVVLTGTTVLRRATPGAVAEALGLTIQAIPDRCFDVVVVGAGPAGLAASVYAASEGLGTLIVESTAPGGQAGTSSRIENYLGFPNGVSGRELTDRAMTQALKFGVRMSTPCDVATLEHRGGHLVVVLDDGTEIAGRAVICATGAHYRRLPIDRLDELEGAGVYYAATEVEARLVAGAPVVIVGGGNSAGQAALFLAASGCAVDLVLRGPDLGRSMSSYLADRIEADARVTVRTDTRCLSLGGASSLTSVRLASAGAETEIPAVGLFSFIGAEPATEWLCGLAALDAGGFVRTDLALGADDLGAPWTALGRRPLPFESSEPGLFAVGDVRAGSVKRVASAVGEGSAVIRSVHEHLSFAPR